MIFSTEVAAAAIRGGLATVSFDAACDVDVATAAVVEMLGL